MGAGGVVSTVDIFAPQGNQWLERQIYQLFTFAPLAFPLHQPREGRKEGASDLGEKDLPP